MGFKDGNGSRYAKVQTDSDAWLYKAARVAAGHSMHPMHGALGLSTGRRKQKMRICPVRMFMHHPDKALKQLAREQADECHTLQEHLNMERYGKHVKVCQVKPAPYGKWA